MHLRVNFLPLLLAVFVCAGCKLGPDYKRPEVQTPTNWRWKAAEPQDHVSRGEWWNVFRDPELDALMIQAGDQNLNLQAAFARVEQARAAARIDRSQFYPSLTSSPSFVRYRTSGNAPSPVPFPVPSFTQQQWTMPFDLSYELDLWGRVRRSFESAQQLALSAEAARQSVLLTLQADVAATYFSLRSVTRQIELLEQAIELREEGVRIFQQRSDAGIGSEFEVQRGRTEAAVARAELQAAQRRRGELLNGLAVLCGKAPAGFEPRISSADWILPVIAPGVPSAVLERRPDVAQAERELAASMAQIGVAKAAFFPSVRLTASGGFLSGEVSDLFAWDSHTWSIGPGISLPIFQGGRNRAGLERARAVYDESVAIYRQQVLTAFKEVEDNLAGLQFLGHEVEARRQAAEAATQAAKLSFERYRAGAIAFLELIDSENARLQNELLRVRAANEQTLATVRLVKALGGGWEQ